MTTRAEYAVELAKLSDAKLAKKIRHLRKAVGRCSLQENADRIVGFHEEAMAEVKRRISSLSRPATRTK